MCVCIRCICNVKTYGLFGLVCVLCVSYSLSHLSLILRNIINIVVARFLTAQHKRPSPYTLHLQINKAIQFNVSISYLSKWTSFKNISKRVGIPSVYPISRCNHSFIIRFNYDSPNWARIVQIQCVENIDVVDSTMVWLWFNSWHMTGICLVFVYVFVFSRDGVVW